MGFYGGEEQIHLIAGERNIHLSYFNIVTAQVRLGSSVEREIESNQSSAHRLGLSQCNTDKLG